MNEEERRFRALLERRGICPFCGKEGKLVLTPIADDGYGYGEFEYLCRACAKAENDKMEKVDCE